MRAVRRGAIVGRENNNGALHQARGVQLFRDVTHGRIQLGDVSKEDALRVGETRRWVLSVEREQVQGQEKRALGAGAISVTTPRRRRTML